jgi:hypothetical protein
MPDPDSGPNFSSIITAVATAATALFAFLAYRLALRSEAPLVECDDPKWTQRGIFIRIRIQNQSGLVHKLTRCRVIRPRKAKLILLQSDKETAPQKEQKLDRDMRPAGSASNFGRDFPVLHWDQASLELLLLPPSGWASGEVRISLWMVDKSARPRHRRLVISRLIQAAPAKITADNAKQVD